MGPRHPHQPQRLLPLHPGGGSPHARRRRRDRQHRIRLQQGAVPRSGRLHREQGRHRDADQGRGGRAGAAPHPRQLRRPGRRSRSSGRGSRWTTTPAPGARSRRSAASACPKTSRGPCASSASDDSAFVTGQTLWVDGGLFTQPPWPKRRGVIRSSDRREYREPVVIRSPRSPVLGSPFHAASTSDPCSVLSSPAHTRRRAAAIRPGLHADPLPALRLAARAQDRWYLRAGLLCRWNTSTLPGSARSARRNGRRRPASPAISGRRTPTGTTRTIRDPPARARG